MEYEKIIFRKEGQIAKITLNDPEKLNAIPYFGGIREEFLDALTKAEDDDDVKVVVINGAGHAFCAGHALDGAAAAYGMEAPLPGQKARRVSQRRRLHVDGIQMVDLSRFCYCKKVTIASVHGYAYGAGMDLACLSDLTIASDDAVFAKVDQRLGFAGSGIPLLPLIFSVGWKRARELVLTGREISAEEAYRIGLVNKVVPRDKLEEETEKLAKAICLHPKDGLAISKIMYQMRGDILGFPEDFRLAIAGHSLFGNIVWDPDEFNFFREVKDRGFRATIHEMQDRFRRLLS